MPLPGTGKFYDLLRDAAKVYEASQSELRELHAEVHKLRAQHEARAELARHSDAIVGKETNDCSQSGDQDHDEFACVPQTPLPALLLSQAPGLSGLDTACSPDRQAEPLPVLLSSKAPRISGFDNDRSPDPEADAGLANDFASPMCSISSTGSRKTRARRQSLKQMLETRCQQPDEVEEEGSRVARLGSYLSKEADTAWLGETEKAQRLMQHFGECADVSQQSLLRALLNTGTEFAAGLAEAQELAEAVMEELLRIAQALQAEGKIMENVATGASNLPWRLFVELMSMPKLSEYAIPSMANLISYVQTLLLSRQVHELIEYAAELQATESSMDLADTTGMSWHKRLLLYINHVVSLAIIASIASMGFSLDNSPEALGWKVAESIVAMIFMAEVVLKLSVEGYKEYFSGKEKYWNWFDLVLVTLALADLACELLGASLGSTRMSLVLRGVRMSRIFRLFKIFRSPMAQELSNLISGVASGLPALMWIIVVIILFIYFCGIAGRQAFGPSEDSLLSTCEPGDSYDSWDTRDAVCKIHHVYGTEFCGSVESCMFTTFRCMLGDCNTAGGRSIAAIFSQGYGIKFRLFYCVSMIITVFGFFNVVTAMMVEATVSGLKHNEVQKKCKRIQESKYVARKLEQLVSVMSDLTTKYRQKCSMCQLSAQDWPRFSNAEKVTSLTPQELRHVFDHADTKSILADLDVAPDPCLLDMFELYASDSDSVSVTDIIAVLFKLRGDVQKLDLVSLRESVCEILKDVQVSESSISSSQQKILQSLEELSARLPVLLEQHDM